MGQVGQMITEKFSIRYETALNLWLEEKMSNTQIVAVTVPHKIKLSDPDREIDIQLTLTVPDGLTLGETEECINTFLKSNVEFKEKVIDFVAKKDVPIPPVIDWDYKTLKELELSSVCKKCNGAMVVRNGISAKTGKPYLGVCCTDRKCNESFWYNKAMWNYVKNTAEVLAFYPDWQPKDYKSVEETPRLTLDEIATITEKTTAEIKALATKKRHKLKDIITFDAALNLVAKDLGAIKT